MASIVQLKRSALSGKVPDTGSLNLGELAVNTYDGKIYFKKSGSIESIESVVTTNSVVTGSIRLEGTGSFGSLKVNDTLTVNHGVSVISGSLGITSDLTVLGTVNARQFNIAIISSSTLFESGSSNFGNSLDDTHTFTGSVNITGSFLLNGQEVGGGTTTGSFTGSFTGDGSGLRGVVSDDIPRDGWDYQSNSSASINDFNNVSDKYYIDFEQSQSTAVGTPVGFKGFLTNVSGSTQILPTLDSIDFIVGDTLVASIDANGIQATIPAGTISGSSQLTSSYDTRYVLSGSITQTTWDNIASKPSGIVSGSSQLTSSVLATTGSNTFVGTQILSGSILPAIDNTYDLGSATYQWRDIFVSSGSLYIDGTKVLGSTGNELQITTDEGQSIKILEAGSDSIILQSADGDIQLKTSGGGNLLFDPTTGLIDVRGTLQIQDGNKITSSGGNSVVFGNNIVVSGSLESTGNINGINLATFSSSVVGAVSNVNSLNLYTSSLNTAISTSGSNVTILGNLTVAGTQTIVDSTTIQIGDNIIELNGTGATNAGLLVKDVTAPNTNSGSLLWDSTNDQWKAGVKDTESKILVAGGDNVVSGSSQITFSGISSLPTLVSGSSQIDVMSTTNIARLATTGSNIFSGNQSITGSGSGLYLGGGNNRIYFSNYRALEGATDGTNLQVGEGYSKVILQSTSTQVNGNLTPDTNGTRDLGSSSYRWSTVYTSDLSLNNGIGDWTIVEGEDDLFLYNNKKGKVYKFALTEIDPLVATPKKS
jgi:hypothetical protein